MPYLRSRPSAAAARLGQSPAGAVLGLGLLMRQRLIGAAVLVPVVVILFVAGPPWLTLGIALLAAAARTRSRS